jgi:hypothetical protein
LKKVEALKKALERTPAAPGKLDKDLHQVRAALLALDEQLSGSRSRRQVGEKNNPTIGTRLNTAMSGTTSYGPTPTHRRSFEIAKSEFRDFQKALHAILQEDLPALEKAVAGAGGPVVK